MPNPVKVSKIDLSSLAIDDAKDSGDAKNSDDAKNSYDALGSVDVVDFGGIMHLIIRGIEATEKNFEAIRDFIMAKFNPPAMGVMFCDGEMKKEGDSLICQMTPVVYVKDVDTTYFEGSCGSGTTACSAAFGLKHGDGVHHFVFPQPAGTIESTAHISEGRIEKIFIEGKVELSPEMEVEIDI